MTARARAARTQFVLWASVCLLSGSAWLSLWLSSESQNGLLHYHHVGDGFLLRFLSGWTIMTIAMMLPTTVPILTVVDRFASARRDRPVLVSATIVGYVLAWALFGAAVYCGAQLVRWGLGPLFSEPKGASVPLAVTLLLAGAFQFTSWKYRCLDKCRSPLSFVISYWRGRRHLWMAFRLGVDHGIFCVGCCWALMLLMFVVGSGSLAWMFALGAVMAIEKNMPWGRRASAPIGVALLVWGGLLLAIR